MRKGFTLVECAVAGALLATLALVFLQGIGVATRIAEENARLLAADGVAWDAVWKTFNEDYDSIAIGSNTVWLSESAAPSLYVEGSKAELMIVVESFSMGTKVDGDWKFFPMKSISANVTWGPQGSRKSLSDYHDVFVYRSDVRRGK